MAATLRVKVQDARGLQLPMLTMSREVYVLVSTFGVDAQTDICEMVKDMAIWDEMFDLPLAPDWQRHQKLLIQVYHRGTVHMMRPLGQATIPLGFLHAKPGMADTRFHGLCKVDNETKFAGEIRVGLRVMTAPQQPQVPISPGGFAAYDMQAYGLPPPHGGQPMFAGAAYGGAPLPHQQQPHMMDQYAAPPQQRPGPPPPGRPPGRGRDAAGGPQPPPPEQQQAVVLQAGDVLDNKYHVQKLLGKGNFGTAYLAKSEVDDQMYVTLVAGRLFSVGELVRRLVGGLRHHTWHTCMLLADSIHTFCTLIIPGKMLITPGTL